MKQRLEGLVNGVKKFGKRAFIAVTTLAMLHVPIKAGEMTIFEDTEIPVQYAQTTIAYNKSDFPFFENMPPALDGYLLKETNRLLRQSKDVNDFSDFYGQMQTTGVEVGQPAWWKAEINNSDGTFDDKNITVKIYDKNADVNDPNSETITVFDPFYESINNPEYFGWFQSGSFEPQTQGIHGQIIYDVSNHADLNRDRKVDGKDYAIFANNWGRTGIVKGSDPNNLDDYADIENLYDERGNLVEYGNGTVDYNDLFKFSDQWLWDADDPNTW